MMKKWIWSLVIVIVLSFAATTQAMVRFPIVTTQNLQQLLEERSQGTMQFLLVNTLDMLIAEHHSIPGSVNIPWSRIAELSEQLGNNKEKLIITYCMGYR